MAALFEKALSGCRFAYIDIGTNRGDRINDLYAYNRHKKFYNGCFPLQVPRSSVCAVGFEPNPVHFKRLQNLATGHRYLGHNVTILPFAISNETSSHRFYVDDMPQFHYWGSSLIKWKGSSNRTHQVHTISLSSLLAVLPPMQRVCVKMDAEGAEYDAIPPSVDLMCKKVDVIQLEEHPKLLRLSMKYESNWKAKAKRLRKTLQDLPTDCRMRVQMLSNSGT